MCVLFLIFLLIDVSYAQDIKIVLNPNNITPLSAVARLSHTNREDVTIVVKGKDESDSIGVVYPAGYGTEFPIHGLYENYNNSVVVSYNGDKHFNVVTKKNEYMTKPLPNSEGKREDRVINMTTKVNVDKLPKDDMFNYDLYFTSFPNAYYIVGFDRKGDLRYVMDNKKEVPVMMRMEHDKDKVYFLYISDNKYYTKRDLIGNEIFRMRYDSHHESVPYVDGKEIILGNSRWGWEDVVFELDKDKNIIKCLHFGDVIRKAVDPSELHLLDKMIYDYQNIYTDEGKSVRVDWAHANSLVYDKKTDILYLSLRHLGVLAVKYNTWTLEWFLADDTLKTSSGVKYGEKPEDSIYLVDVPSLQKYRLKAKKNPRGQHALFLTGKTLLMFDNRSAGTKGDGSNSRVLEYRIDTINMIAEVVREFEQDVYTRYVGDIDFSGSKHENWLIFSGLSKPKQLLEVAPDDEILFDMDINTSSLMYRVDKYPLYPYKNKNKKYTLDYIK